MEGAQHHWCRILARNVESKSNHEEIIRQVQIVGHTAKQLACDLSKCQAMKDKQNKIKQNVWVTDLD